MIKYFLCCLFLFACTQKSIQPKQQLPQAGSIGQVASQFINDLYQDKQVRVFRFDLPPAAALPDHITEPRIVLLLTDLNGQRLKDGTAVTAKTNQAFYLTNTFSAGFKNTSADTASYLVISLGQRQSMDRQQSVDQQQTVNLQQTCPNAAFQALLDKGPVLVCRSLEMQTQVNKDGKKILIYSQLTSQVHSISDQATSQLDIGDLMFLFSE